MPRLILINGPPASGKSTLARRYIAEHRLALGLDVNVVRSLLCGWLDCPAEAGVAARALAIEMARTHLRAGFDVVVPQLLARPRLAERLEALAHETESRFVEVALELDVERMLDRFTQRTDAGDRIEHRDAAELVNRGEGLQDLVDIREQMMAMLVARPIVRWVKSREGDVNETYRRFLAHVEVASGHS